FVLHPERVPPVTAVPHGGAGWATRASVTLLCAARPAHSAPVLCGGHHREPPQRGARVGRTPRASVPVVFERPRPHGPSVTLQPRLVEPGDRGGILSPAAAAAALFPLATRARARPGVARHLRGRVRRLRHRQAGCWDDTRASVAQPLGVW